MFGKIGVLSETISSVCKCRGSGMWGWVFSTHSFFNTLHLQEAVKERFNIYPREATQKTEVTYGRAAIYPVSHLYLKPVSMYAAGIKTMYEWALTTLQKYPWSLDQWSHFPISPFSCNSEPAKSKKPRGSFKPTCSFSISIADGQLSLSCPYWDIWLIKSSLPSHKGVILHKENKSPRSILQK